MDIEEHEEVVIENTSMCVTNVVVREEHVYLDYRAFFQRWINGPDRKYFKEHTGRDTAFVVELRLGLVGSMERIGW